MHIYIYCQKKMAIRDILPFQKKKRICPRLFITYPKSYAKETPFMALLLNSHTYIYSISIIHTLYLASFSPCMRFFGAHYIHVTFSSEIDVQYRKAPVICWCMFITVPQLRFNFISKLSITKKEL